MLGNTFLANLPEASQILNLGGLVVASLGTYLTLSSNNSTQNKFNKLFEHNRVYVEKDSKEFPELVKEEEHGNGTLFKFKVPIGLSLKDFERCKEGLECMLEGEVQVWRKGNMSYIRSYTKAIPERIEFDIEKVRQVLKNKELSLSVGYSRKGYVDIDFTSGAYHLLLAGPTGWGKSVGLREILTSGIINYTPQKLKMFLIDLKFGLEMKPFEKAPHVEDVVYTHEDTIDLLEWVKSEMKRRGNLFRDRNIDKLKDYRQRYDSNMTYILVVFDEYAQFTNNDRVQDLVNELTALGRALGVHFIVSTQRPTVDVIDGNIKNNFSARLALRTPSIHDSKTILDNTEATKLPPIRGRGIYRVAENIEVQIPLLEKEQLVNMLKLRNIELGITNKSEKIKENKNVKKVNFGGVLYAN